MASCHGMVRHIGLRRFMTHIRKMSSTSASDSETRVYHEEGDGERRATWPDSKLNSLDPYDQMRFPLPGNSGLDPTVHLSPANFTQKVAKNQSSVLNTVLTRPTMFERHTEVINQFNSAAADLEKALQKDSKQRDVEVKIQDCPLLMRKDFMDLFPGSDVMRGDFTIISLCQKTENDMTSWSHEIEEEREALMALYVETAEELCSALRNAGFWADFVDPSSGKPYHSPHTNASMFETDERYRHFGFEIEDLGCCKVISHHKWGSKAYVGCVFTNTPADHPLLMEIERFAQ